MQLYVRQRRLGYLGPLLVSHMTVWSAEPEGSLFMDCQGTELKDLDTLTVNRTAWRSKVATLMVYITLYHWTLWVHHEHGDAGDTYAW